MGFLVVSAGIEPTRKNRIFDIVEALFEPDLEHIVFHIGVFGRGSDVSNFDTNLVGNWTDLTHYYFVVEFKPM